MSNKQIYRYPVNFSDSNSTFGIASKYIKKGNAILDIGCFDGRFIKKLKKEKNCSVIGMDINADAVKIAQTNNLDARVFDLDRPEGLLKLPKKSFDVITLLDVLEHLPYPPKLISYLSDLLKDSGKLIISIPNINHVDVAIKIIADGWTPFEDGLLDKTHVHFYSTEEITDLLAKQSLFVQREHHVVVPPGMTNLPSNIEKHAEIYRRIKEYLNPKESCTFQKVFIIGKKRSKKLLYHASMNERPTNYIIQRLGVFFKLLLNDFKTNL